MLGTELEKVLQDLGEELLLSRKQKEFELAFQRISARYRSGEGGYLQTEEERMAYLFTRLPGTFSACMRVFNEIRNRFELKPSSFLDVGAGPGTGTWAALEVFPELLEATLLEKDSRFMNLGKTLAKKTEAPLMEKADFQICDLEKPLEVKSHDLTLLSYSVGELPEKSLEPLLATLWQKTNTALVVIEPGTPRGYQKILLIRKMLLDMGGFLWGPCPHQLSCPLSKEDWCHFSVRVPRSSLHRRLKSGDLGYEDEKFSYVVFGKTPSVPIQGRILRHPLKHSGHIELAVCRENGHMQKETYSKRDADLYKFMKKQDWGDFF